MESSKQTSNSHHYSRQIKSICPSCSLEGKLEIVPGKIYEQDNSIILEKSCLINKGKTFSETLSDDAAFFKRIESFSNYTGPGIQNPNSSLNSGCPQDCGLCSKHKSTPMMTIIDLTNRCNLKCPICFATSNASGYVYEPSFNQVQKMLQTARNIQPSCSPCLQFSGGEPTLHPQFFQILDEARKTGFTQIQIATNGITLANGLSSRRSSGKEFAQKASDSGLNIIYLQFDGVSDDVYVKARGKKLFEIKKQALKNTFDAGIRTILVPTLAKTINNSQIGQIYQFAIDNIDAVSAISFQPIAFTGRELPEEKNKLRFTLTDLASETQAQFPFLTKKDWFPLSMAAPFSRFLEAIKQENYCELTCHPNCGIGTYLFINKSKDQYIPLSRFIDLPGLTSRMQEIYEDVKKKKHFKTIRALAKAVSFRKFYNEDNSPDHMSSWDFFNYFKEFADSKNFSDNERKKQWIQNKKWNFLIVAGMHFQDAYNYQVERVQRCSVHYVTPDNKIFPFCTYNCGPCFRTQVEKQFSKPILEGKQGGS